MILVFIGLKNVIYLSFYEQNKYKLIHYLDTLSFKDHHQYPINSV